MDRSVYNENLYGGVCSMYENEKAFLKSVHDLIGIARRMLWDSYEHTAVPEHALWYHCLAHSDGVFRRAVKIITTCNRFNAGTLSMHDAALVVLAVYFHDIYIASYIIADPRTPHLRLSRKRLCGPSEEGSAAILERYMLEMNKKYRADIFTLADLESVHRMILLTVPKFERGTVIQDISPETPLVFRILPLADLGECGMEPLQFMRNADLLLCEEQPRVQQALLGTYKYQSHVRENILEWAFAQVDFVSGRERRMLEDLSGLPDGLAQMLMEQCFSSNNFERSKDLSNTVHRKRKKMRLRAIVGDMRAVCGIRV